MVGHDISRSHPVQKPKGHLIVKVLLKWIILAYRKEDDGSDTRSNGGAKPEEKGTVITKVNGTLYHTSVLCVTVREVLSRTLGSDQTVFNPHYMLRLEH